MAENTERKTADEHNESQLMLVRQFLHIEGINPGEAIPYEKAVQCINSFAEGVTETMSQTINLAIGILSGFQK